MKWVLIVMTMIIAGFGFANMLTDPGFEDTGSSAWSPYVSTSAIQYDFDETGPKHGGSQSLHITWTSTTDYNVFDAKQYFAVTPGETLEASIYAEVPLVVNSSPMEGYLEIFYKDVNGTDIGSLQSAHVGSVTSDWAQLSVSGIIPDNTVTAMYRIVIFGGPQSTGGTILFDDAFLQIPEPSTGLLALFASGVIASIRRFVTRRG